MFEEFINNELAKKIGRLAGGFLDQIRPVVCSYTD
jgi:hypothetical protein